jgi:hypothetical protein
MIRIKSGSVSQTGVGPSLTVTQMQRPIEARVRPLKD